MKPAAFAPYVSTLALAAVAALALSACGARGDTPATQIAAKVNKEEISVHQINYLLQRRAGLKPEQLDEVSRKTLDALIDQEVTVQAAEAQKLDRDPAVMMALENARRDVLTRAFTDKLTETAALPAAEDVKRYYNSQPALFAQRKLYTLVDTAVEAGDKQQQELGAKLANTRGADDVAAVLRNEGLRFATRQSTVGAETLPLQTVDAMSRMHPGQSLLLPGPGQAHILTVVATEPAPLDEAASKQAIENFLVTQNKRELVEREIKSLRSVARVEYQGKFAQTSEGAVPALPAASGAAAPVAPSASAAVAVGRVPVALK